MHRARNNITLLFAFITSTTILSSCNQQPPFVGNDVVASVNDSVITQLDISFASQSAASHQYKSTDNDNSIVLEKIIDQELGYQRALELELDKDPAYLKELTLMQVQVDAFKRKKLSALLIQHEIEQDSDISENEAKRYYNDNEKRLRTTVNVWQILRRDENDIKRIKEELAAGESFETLAGRQFAGMEFGKRKPWDMGYLQWNQMPEAWLDEIADLEIGETSKIIRGPNKRYWLIKLIDKHENPDITFERSKAMIIDKIKKDKIQQTDQQIKLELRNRAKIVYTNKPTP